MPELKIYKTIAEKNQFFRSSRIVKNNTIDDIKTFDTWYRRFEKRVKERDAQSNEEPFLFRGTSEAKYMLYNSAQRTWISKDVEHWNKEVSYQQFLEKFIEEAKRDNLFSRVFDFYKVMSSGQDFPILSILQHYGGPTPLMDWTLDIDVALFFAVDEINFKQEKDETDSYFAIYIIDNEKSKIKSIASIADSEYRSLDYVMSRSLNETTIENLYYLSDYEKTNAFGSAIRNPLTTIYNQNIIAQKGLFIFNPLPDVPLEKYFDKNDKSIPPFRCYNIKKQLGEYIRRKIASKGINERLIYPDINDKTNQILQLALNSYFKQP